MRISLPMILERMNQYNMQLSDNVLTIKTSINGSKILKTPMKAYQEDVLYIVQNSYAPADSNGAYPVHILHVQSDSNFYLKSPEKSSQLFIISSNEDLNKILEDVLDTITYYRNLFDHLITASLEGQGLSKMLDIASIHFENPVVVYDMSMKLLAYSSVHCMNDETWLEIVHKGYLDFTGSLSSGIKYLLQTISNNNSALIFDHSQPGFRFISKNILVSNNIAAMLHIVEKDHSLTRGSLDTAESISTILSIEMEKNNLMHYKYGLLHEQFLIDLLEKKITTIQALNFRAKNLGWHLSKRVYCLVVAPDADFLTDEQLSHFITNLAQIISSARGIVYNNGIVLIISTNSNIPFSESARKALFEFLSRKNLYAGLSRGSDSLLDVPELYNQAIKAIKLGKYIDPTKMIYPYSDYSLFAFFDDCLQQEDVKKYLHPSLHLLSEYDKKSQTDLISTLRYYVNNRNNQVKTANQLFVHRTTLLYRIRKIEEIVNVDLDDPDINFHIQLSFRLADYALKSSSLPNTSTSTQE